MLHKTVKSTSPDIADPLRPDSQDDRDDYTTTPALGVELSVIIPTFNERANVLELIQRLQTTLVKYRWEVIFVDDDSPDETARLVREIAQCDIRVRCIQRIARRGLSSACTEGMLSSSAPYMAVIDGDLQHDETLLPKMLEVLKHDKADIVVGTRYSPRGGLGEWDRSRVAISRVATWLSRLVLKAELSDPMSGFFMLRREVFEHSVRSLSGIGYKILVDIIASSEHPPRLAEIPYDFRTRESGESKLDARSVWDYLMLLIDKFVGHIVPVRFISFCLIGGFGVIAHFVVLGFLFNEIGLGFTYSQATATFVAMAGNYALNNLLTYRDMRLRGWQWLRGWVSFTAACSIGALANVGVASYLFSMDQQWGLAALAGILVSTVWNYAVTMVYTWKIPQKA
ncbi:MAG: glycosyltransferase family 2 protein [Woeseiaceae bacterium]|nr:glycosyltransferase family 2 protein [Woeseiaceae bacterium]